MAAATKLYNKSWVVLRQMQQYRGIGKCLIIHSRFTLHEATLCNAGGIYYH